MADENPVTLNTAEAFRVCTLELVCAARRQLTIFSPDLEPLLYDRPEVIEALTALIKRSKHTQIRILVRDSKPLLEIDHQILRLFRYTDDQFQLKKSSADPAMTTSAYLVCDDHALIRRQNTDIYQGFYYRNDRARARDQLQDFDQLWNSALNDPNLRQLTV